MSFDREEHPLDMDLPAELVGILANTPELAGARLVGGCVRDALLGKPSKDIDVEVYGIGLDALGEVLQRLGSTDQVGRAFGVFKLRLGEGREVDFSLPRRDSHVGTGHRGFEVEFDPSLTLHEASARRDFTVNAMSWDPRRRVVEDPHGGLEDLRRKRLRHTSAAFTEDPLRVLRGMQIASRLDFEVAPETVELCRSIRDTYRDLAPERVREEWFKWASKSVRPSRGLRFLAECDWLSHFPELEALRGTRQDPEWHPEGDVWVHTCHCLDALVEDTEWLEADDVRRTTWSFAVLLHDVGKPATTRTELRDGKERIVAPGHDQEGAPIAEAFLARIAAPSSYGPRVAALVREHMAHLSAKSPAAVRRLADRLGQESIQSLAVVVRADMFGRPPLERVVPEDLHVLLRQAEALAVRRAAPARWLQGWHLMELGWRPGPVFKATLDAAYDAQLAEGWSDPRSAWDWLVQRHGAPAAPSGDVVPAADIEALVEEWRALSEDPKAKRLAEQRLLAAWRRLQRPSDRDPGAS